MSLSRPRILALIAAIAAGLVVIGALSYPAVERFYQRQQAEKNVAPLKLAAESLRAALDRYAPLPALIAERPSLVTLLAEPDDKALLAAVNEDLRQTAATVRASDVFLLDISGRTIAAASYREPRNFLDRNFSYQTYFTQALNGFLSSFQVYGTTTGERGYYYAAPVEDGERIVGVLAVKFNIAAFESVWRGADAEFIVSDRNDFVLMSSRPDWHFRAMRPLSAATRLLIAQNLQYPIDRIEILPITAEPLAEGAALIDVEGAVAGGVSDSFVMTTLHMSERDWNISSLQPTLPATLNAVYSMVMAGLVALLVLSGMLAYMLKQARQAEALAREQGAKRALEAAVTERTADLQIALADLKRTQTDLIQAGKLSGLGQMSAALSHEFNQPLAAVKTYADNAEAFLDRDRMAEARENIRRISKMVDRMAKISAHLRNFARRPKLATGPLLLGAVIKDALAVIDMRTASEGGRVDYQPPEDDVWVKGGHVRLQQVIVNLINNAFDAMEGRSDPVVELRVTGTTLQVRDHGAGLDPDIIGQIFDPFFTTKAMGKGLGLGLSISFNIVRDFGGSLTAENHPEGGAVFSVHLQAEKPNSVAAQ